MDRNQELEERVRNLSQTIEEMRNRMARLEGRNPDGDDVKQSNRRGFLRLGAGAVLGALGWAAVKAIPASAATGGNMLLGCANSADAATTLASTGVNQQVLAVEAAGQTFAGTFTGPLQGLGTSTGIVDGVDGWAGGNSGAGVHGLTDSGYGVIGEADTGIGLYAQTSGRIRQDGLLAPGLPSYTPNNYEQVRDSAGILWIHNATGSWRRVNTVRVDAADGSGVPFTPLRLVDTRSGTKPAKNSTIKYLAAGAGLLTSSIPTDAIAVMGNLTAVGYSGVGFLTISPAGVNSTTSSINFITGQGAIANSFIVGLGTGADLGKLQVHVSNNTACHYIVDITAYIQ
jgi:hypothetical protein